MFHNIAIISQDAVFGSVREFERYAAFLSQFRNSCIIAVVRERPLRNRRTRKMFCIKCGTENSDEAVFCQKCGARTEAEEETRVARRPDTFIADDTAEPLFSISPTLRFVKAGYAGAVVAAFVLVAFFSIFFSGVSWMIAVGFGLLLLLIPAYFHIRQKLTRYRLTDSTIEIDRGLISRTTQNIPLRRIQDVTVSSTLFQRVLGYGDITVDNASDDGGKIVLDNIDSPRKYADMVLKQMRHLDR